MKFILQLMSWRFLHSHLMYILFTGHGEAVKIDLKIIATSENKYPKTKYAYQI